MMTVLHKEIEVVEQGNHRRWHHPERNHQNVPTIPDLDSPEQKGIS